LWADEKAVVPGSDVTLDLPVGLHTITIAVDLQQRGDEGVRVEVADAPGSTGHAQPVGGK
jgi:hypothetical protein